MNELKQFDLIRIITTRNVRYVSDIKNSIPNPNENWTVIGVVEKNVLANKNSAVISVPIDDVVKVGNYSVENFLRKLNNGKTK